MMVTFGVVFRGEMALRADAVAGRTSFCECGSWQSLQVTPFAFMRLWRKEP